MPTEKRIRFPCNSIPMPPAGYMLFQLQLGVDSDIADLTVEGAFLSVGVRGQLPSLLRAGFRTQAWVRFNGSQSTSSLQDSFVFGTFVMCLQLREGIDSNFAQGAVKKLLGLLLL